ncbi:MAG: DUF262 domain-containing protein [Bacilli bacterium]|nr:DUF262 domain-containing protein [Bacilli bacterium]
MKVQYRYEPFQLNDIISDKTIKVPQFQRNIVWNTKKRKEFVETLRKGNPFGSILVHQNENKEYSLIDGLQRVSTIKNYYKNPFDYFDYIDLNGELVKELIKHHYENNGIRYEEDSEAVKQLSIEMQKRIFSRLKNGESATHIAFELVKEFSLISDEISFSIINKIIDDFNEDINISDLLVPAIVYTGPSENLPTIFYNLNTGGVNLSKYETFSSLWDSRKYKLNDEDINNKIFEKYAQMREKSDLDVDISEEDIIENGVTLFEYCYSISEILHDKNRKYNLIFGTNKKSTDPIGFEIISLAVGLDVNRAEKLGLKAESGKKGVLVGATAEFLVKLKNIIIETFDNITKSLEYWIVAENGTNNTLDSTYMIYHMAVSYIRHNYIIDTEKFQIDYIGNRIWNEKYCKYLPLYYLKDYITDFWKINRQVSDLTREINSDDSLQRYVKNISMNEWDEALNKFRENQLTEVGTTISLKSKLFLDYLIKYKFEENSETRKYFNKNLIPNMTIDFEHIIPQKRIENQLGRNNIKSYPVSSLGNICYLASIDNRAKREKTIYEFIADRPSFIVDHNYLDLIDYPPKEDLRFIDYSSIEFDEKYKTFISNRIDMLFNKFKEFVKNKYN